MAKISVEVKNIDRLYRKIQSMDSRASSGVEKALMKGAVKVAGDAKKNLTSNGSVDSGLLRASIHATRAKTSSGEVAARVGTSVEYAPYVEFGTGARGASTNKNTEVSVSYKSGWLGQVAKPFLWPALRANRETIRQFIAQEISKISKGK